MSDNDDAYGAFRDDSVPTNLMNVLVQLSDELLKAEKIKEEKTEELRLASEMVTNIKERRIPDAAEGVQGKINLPDGRTLEITEKVRASIAGDKRIPAIKWLDDNDYGSIVKRELVFQFNREDEDKFKRFVDHVKSSGIPVTMRENFSVHHSTLEAFVRERLKEGDDIDRSILGVYIQKDAKVK